MIASDEFLVLNVVNQLQSNNVYCGELPFEYIYDLQKWKLITNVSKIPDKLLILYKLQNAVFNELCRKYDDNCASLFVVTQAIWNHFARSVC